MKRGIVSMKNHLNKEIREAVASIDAVKNFTKDIDLIFNFLDDDGTPCDKNIDALSNVISSATNYVNQFFPLEENEIVEYTPVYDAKLNCWIVPINKQERYFYAHIFRKDNGMVYDDKIPFENDRFYKKEIKLQDIPDKCPE